MAERNIDKLRRVQQENAALRERITNQNMELARQRGLVREAVEGTEELRQAVDALCIAVALKFGTQVADDVWEMTFPSPDMPELLQAYRLDVQIEDGRHVIRVEDRVCS